MPSKGLYLGAFNQELSAISNFHKIRKKSQIQERFPPGKDARRFFDKKGVSAPQKLSDFF